MTNTPSDPNSPHAPNRPAQKLVIALAVVQAVCVAIFLPAQWALVRIGAMAPLGPFLAIIATVLLSLGALLLALRGTGRSLLLVSASLFLLATVWVWREPTSPLLKHSSYTLGTALAIYAWWLARTRTVDGRQLSQQETAADT